MIDIRTFVIPSRSVYLEWETLQTTVVEKMKTHILSSIFFCFRKSCHLWNNVEKYGRVGQTTGENMEHAKCMLNNKRYKHTLRICNTCFFPPATTVKARASMLRFTYMACLLYLSSLFLKLSAANLTFRTYPFRLRITGSLRFLT